MFINGLVEHYGEKLQGCFFFANDLMGVSESVKQLNLRIDVVCSYYWTWETEGQCL